MVFWKAYSANSQRYLKRSAESSTVIELIRMLTNLIQKLTYNYRNENIYKLIDNI